MAVTRFVIVLLIAFMLVVASSVPAVIRATVTFPLVSVVVLRLVTVPFVTSNPPVKDTLPDDAMFILSTPLVTTFKVLLVLVYMIRARESVLGAEKSMYEPVVLFNCICW